jgi:PAS domain S-box-containing protein
MDENDAERGRAADPPAEVRFRSLFSQTPHPMAVLAPDGRIVEANRALAALAGVAAAELVGRPFAAAPWWAGEAAPARLVAALRRAAGGVACREELDARGGDGRELVLDWAILPVCDEAGRVLQLVAEARDATEAKWAERALRISEAKFAGIVSIASDAIISIDESQSILHFNTGAETIFGWRAEEVLGRPIDVLIPDRFRSVHREHVRRFAESAVTARRMGERAEILGLRQSGEEFPADASISKLEVGGERIFTVVLRDVTERKRAEATQGFLAEAGALLASSLDYETTLRSVTRLALPRLADWAVLYVERSPEIGLQRLEVAHADAARQPLLNRLNDYPLARTPGHPVYRAMETGEPVLVAEVDAAMLDEMAVDATHRRLYEELGLRSLILTPLVGRDRTVGAIGFYSATRTFDAQDLSLATDLAVRAALALENAKLYHEAQHAVQVRDDVLAVVSHDLGNPLSAIRIGAKLVLRRLSEDAAAAKQVEGIRQAAEQMERLVHDLLDVKRLEAGQLMLDRRRVQPASLLAEVVEMIGNLGEERGQVLECAATGPLPPVSADRARTLQVLQNLLGNAIKFTPPGGRIELSAESQDGVVRFRVSDTGPGVPAEHLPLMFDRFWQAKREGRLGLGLGLAIAKGIVEAHGGRIWAESREGVGTTVYFTLPVAEGGSI